MGHAGGVFREAEIGLHRLVRTRAVRPCTVSASPNARSARPIRLGFAEPPSPTGKENGELGRACHDARGQRGDGRITGPRGCHEQACGARREGGRWDGPLRGSLFPAFNRPDRPFFAQQWEARSRRGARADDERGEPEGDEPRASGAAGGPARRDSRLPAVRAPPRSPSVAAKTHRRDEGPHGPGRVTSGARSFRKAIAAGAEVRRRGITTPPSNGGDRAPAVSRIRERHWGAARGARSGSPTRRISATRNHPLPRP